MRRAFLSELVKLGRRSTLLTAGAVLPALALLATALMFVQASSTATLSPDAPPFAQTYAQLEQAGGLTAGFAGANGFLGVLVFVLFLTSFSSEHSQGTLRTLLVREPRRGRLLLGKLGALLLLVAGSLLVAEVVSGLLAVVLAPAYDVFTANWFGTAGLERALGDYANALVATSLYGAVGASVGVLVRSTAVGLAIGLAWLLPLEHIIENAWADARRWFPGLLFETVASGGTVVASYERGLLLGGAFALVILGIGATTFVRRDVSG